MYEVIVNPENKLGIGITENGETRSCSSIELECLCDTINAKINEELKKSPEHE